MAIALWILTEGEFEQIRWKSFWIWDGYSLINKTLDSKIMDWVRRQVSLIVKFCRWLLIFTLSKLASLNWLSPSSKISISGHLVLFRVLILIILLSFRLSSLIRSISIKAKPSTLLIQLYLKISCTKWE